jgi:hypothetical protein
MDNPEARVAIPKSVMEAMLLEFLQAYPRCKEAASISIERLAVREDGANWKMHVYNPGRALRADCDVALRVVLPIMQRHFDLAADA